MLAPSKNTEYLIDSYGYLAKDKVIKAANGSYYMANKYGWYTKTALLNGIMPDIILVKTENV